MLRSPRSRSRSTISRPGSLELAPVNSAILAELKKQTRLALINGWNPLSPYLDWQAYTLTSPIPLAPGATLNIIGTAGTNSARGQAPLFSQGWLHSMSAAASSGLLTVNLTFYSRSGRQFVITGSLTQFWSGGYMYESPFGTGLEIQNNTVSGSVVTPPPEWTARLVGGRDFPFYAPLSLSVSNPSPSTPIVIYGYAIELLLIDEAVLTEPTKDDGLGA